MYVRHRLRFVWLVSGRGQNQTGSYETLDTRNHGPDLGLRPAFSVLAIRFTAKVVGSTEGGQVTKQLKHIRAHLEIELKRLTEELELKEIPSAAGGHEGRTSDCRD